MKSHLLLEKAYIYPIEREETDMKNYKFDAEKGYWINLKSFEAFIKEPFARKPRSKKCDRETGEDQKGE
ncbi:hypothetical protein [Paenibacillus terrae]|uniref:Uncharacterized protein n=1 Tax=Paenibacillus terrae TaxID=159743 RepID=A0A0D7WU38_9BACL|nr:hypothetical protein [Paenibacillus terrae]KJD42685.1 hypothetical protein QD47_26845 [Paenibacillus terrae]